LISEINLFIFSRTFSASRLTLKQISGKQCFQSFFHLSTTFICYLFHFLLYIFFLLLTTNFYFHLLIHLSIFSLLSTTFICYFVFLEVSFLFCFTFCFKFFPSFY
jgi:hypothetical protein